MRIGLYGLPTAGKTYILNQIHFMEAVFGSQQLKASFPNFDSCSSTEKKLARKTFAHRMMKKESFIMDGHYAFGDEIAFTEDDGDLYDVFLYLYISPQVLKDRMMASCKNKQYMQYDIQKWQQDEITGLRKYCHNNNKDFYVLDNPPENNFKDVTEIVDFIKDIIDGYSCKKFAQKCVERILQTSTSKTIVLLDGDKTLTVEDSSYKLLHYQTHLFDGNFYTGYQAWKQFNEFQHYSFNNFAKQIALLSFNQKIRDILTHDSFILTSGHNKIWSTISRQIGITCFCGKEMAADTKYFITKYLQQAEKKVIAYGDGINDFFMLKQADKGYLVKRQDGSVSKSLKNMNLEGLILV